MSAPPKKAPAKKAPAEKPAAKKHAAPSAPRKAAQALVVQSRAPLAAVRTPRPKKGSAVEQRRPIDAWSYSRLSTWKECPYLAYLKYVEKRKEPDNPAQARGHAIHKAAEDFVVGRVKTLIPELVKFKKEFAALRKAGASAERELAFTSSWKLTDWFAKNSGPERDAWVRIKIDATLFRKDRSALIVDYKTGRQYMPDHEDQLELYAVAAFLLEPEVETVRCEDWYVDSGAKLERTYTREKDLARLLKKWNDEVAPMMADTTFPKNPSSKCRRCHFRQSNGGPCTY